MAKRAASLITSFILYFTLPASSNASFPLEQLSVADNPYAATPTKTSPEGVLISNK